MKHTFRLKNILVGFGILAGSSVVGRDTVMPPFTQIGTSSPQSEGRAQPVPTVQAFLAPPEAYTPDSWPSDRLPRIGWMEITLNELRNLSLILMTKEEAKNPDVFTLAVSDQKIELQTYCYFSWADGRAYRQKIYYDGTGSLPEPFSKRGYELMRQAADGIREAVRGRTPYTIGFGVIKRDFPKATQDAVQKAVETPGGCNLNVVYDSSRPNFRGSFRPYRKNPWRNVFGIGPILKQFRH